MIAPDVSDDVLDNLEERAQFASPGTWMYFPKPKYGEHHVSIPYSAGSFKLPLFEEGCKTERPEEDAKFIAAAHPEVILGIVRYAKHAKQQLAFRTSDGKDRVIRQMARALQEAEASLKKVTREGTQYDAMDIFETLSSIKCAVESANDSGALHE